MSREKFLCERSEEAERPHYLAALCASALKPDAKPEAFFCHISWRQREDTSVGIEMLVDAAVDFLEPFHALEGGLLDAQADADTLEAEMADDEEDGDA